MAKMATKWCRGPNVAAFKLIYALSLACFLWVSAWLIDLNESDNVTAASLDQAQRSRKSYNTQRHSPRTLLLLLLPQPVRVQQVQRKRNSFKLFSCCLSVFIFVCLSVLHVCLVYLSVFLSLCLSIRLNSPSNCSVLYDLFRSITRSLVTESGSDITL